MNVNDPENFVFTADSYEYGVQTRCGDDGEWKMVRSNRFHGWYPSEKSAKNAWAQLKASRGAWNPKYQFRPVRRAVSASEAY